MGKFPADFFGGGSAFAAVLRCRILSPFDGQALIL